MVPSFYLLSLVTCVQFLHCASDIVVAEKSKSNRSKIQNDKTQTSGPECTLRKDKGDCDKSNRRYYYDQATGFCQEFTYTGCGGNLNNFQTIDKCYSRCVCSNPKDKGQGLNKITRYFYNAVKGKCEQFIYRGAGGNSNRFLSLQQCKNTCVRATLRRKCNARPDTGINCNNNSTIQFYYDKHCDCCQRFTYLGCNGNKNRFPTRQQCKKQCIVKEQSTPSPPTRPPKLAICFYQSVYGDCDNPQTRYYYNNRQGKCVPFTYSGCGGNENNFLTVSMCRRTCENNQ